MADVVVDSIIARPGCVYHPSWWIPCRLAGSGFVAIFTSSSHVSFSCALRVNFANSFFDLLLPLPLDGLFLDCCNLLLLLLFRCGLLVPPKFEAMNQRPTS